MKAIGVLRWLSLTAFSGAVWAQDILVDYNLTPAASEPVTDWTTFQVGEVGSGASPIWFFDDTPEGDATAEYVFSEGLVFQNGGRSRSESDTTIYFNFGGSGILNGAEDFEFTAMLEIPRAYNDIARDKVISLSTLAYFGLPGSEYDEFAEAGIASANLSADLKGRFLFYDPVPVDGLPQELLQVDDTVDAALFRWTYTAATGTLRSEIIEFTMDEGEAVAGAVYAFERSLSPEVIVVPAINFYARELRVPLGSLPDVPSSMPRVSRIIIRGGADPGPQPTPIVDLDGDGVPDELEVRYGGNPSDPLDGEVTMSALLDQEWAPRSSVLDLRLGDIALERALDGGFELRLELWRSTDLSEWLPTPAPAIPVDIPDDTVQFLRLRALP